MRSATTDPRHAQGPRRRRTLAALAALAVVVSLVAGAATAAVPAFPDNLVVFPDRDFLSAEGFQDHAGESALVRVTRPGVGVVGSAVVEIGAGEVPFEINHPGGYCWGAGTGVDVTPDIVPGDVVSLRFDDGTTAEVATQDAYVTGVNYADGSDTFTVVGRIGPDVDRANVEQRIVNPELTDTAVGRRDVRAVPGPLAPGRGGAYQSSLEFSGDTFTATYVFADPAVARIAATGGGERLLSWQVTDAAGNRQGITIAEFGEVGGPGMGGCPNGPLASGPPGPSDVTAVNVTSGGGPAIRLNWTPATAIPGTPPITGYRATAVARSVSGGEQVEIGRRIAGQAATGTTITGLRPGEEYDVQVVSMSASGETFPAVRAIPATDATPPALTASPAGGTFATPRAVTLSADEPHVEIYYTLDGTGPLEAADVLTPGALRYTGPIEIASTTTLRAVAFDPAGNVSPLLEETYTIEPAGALPGAPAIGARAAGLGSVSLEWSLDPAYAVTEYRVHVNEADGTPRTDLPENPITTTATSLTIEGLEEGVGYYLTVTAVNANGEGPPSAQVGPLVPLGPVVADAGPDQTVTRGLSPTTVTLDGRGSTSGATYLWEQVGSSPADAVTLTGADSLTPSFVLPLYRYPMTNDPRVFRLTVTSGGITRTDEVRVTPARGDALTITQARWKAGDLRVEGTGTVNGAVVTVHSGGLAGPVLGTATVTAGAWSLRLRNAAAPAARPPGVSAESTLGSTTGPAAVN